MVASRTIQIKQGATNCIQPSENTFNNIQRNVQELTAVQLLDKLGIYQFTAKFILNNKKRMGLIVLFDDQNVNILNELAG